MTETRWHAEDVPWYMVDQRSRGPQTDEDAAMSAPIHLGTYNTEREARVRVFRNLMDISAFNLIRDRGEQNLFTSAADAVLAGVDGVRIHGRYYRVRRADRDGR